MSIMERQCGWNDDETEDSEGGAWLETEEKHKLYISEILASVVGAHCEYGILQKITMLSPSKVPWCGLIAIH
jgi:hypothetical protein